MLHMRAYVAVLEGAGNVCTCVVLQLHVAQRHVEVLTDFGLDHTSVWHHHIAVTCSPCREQDRLRWHGLHPCRHMSFIQGQC